MEKHVVCGCDVLSDIIQALQVMDKAAQATEQKGSMCRCHGTGCRCRPLWSVVICGVVGPALLSVDDGLVMLYVLSQGVQGSVTCSNTSTQLHVLQIDGN